MTFRKWQKDNIPLYLKRFNEKQVELTVAYQGTGKTLYAAACYAISVTNDLNICNFTIENIKNSYNMSLNKNKHFAIIFVPKNSIVESTIENWKKLGIKLIRLHNKDICATSPEILINSNVGGIVVTYGQITNNGHTVKNEWENNHLVKFIKRSSYIKYHAILDEAHNLTIKLSEIEDVKGNLNAKFFLNNSHLFTKKHLISGTVVKKKYDTKTLGRIANRIPFISYTEDGSVIPDTLYTQCEAISDGAIVPTNIIIHSLKNVAVNISEVTYNLTDEDLTWHSLNVSSQKHFHPEYERISNIEKTFKIVYKSLELWEPLICFGNKWLSDVRQHYKKAVGIIFAPTIEVAILIHKKLLSNNSLLCVSKSKNYDFTDTKLILSDNISTYLKNIENNIDWIVSCESLNEGFDYPDAKVSILLPRIEFLSNVKINQSLARINRKISKYDSVEAVCITLKYKPIVDLVENNQNNMFGLISPDTYYSDIIESHTNEIIKNANIKTKIATGEIEPPPVENINITNIELSYNATVLALKNTYTLNYDKETINYQKEINTRTFWCNWNDIVFGNSDSVNKMPPKNVAGCYIIKNAKTQEILYIGSSHNLHSRISNKRRYRECEWIKEEGYQNIYVKWEIVDNYVSREKSLKTEFKPKYDNENPLILRDVG